MMKMRFFAAVLLLFTAAAVLEADQLLVTAQVRDNPTLFIKDLPGQAELYKALRSFVGASGWFDLSNNPESDYVMSSKFDGSTLVFELSLGGIPVKKWSIAKGNLTLRQLAAAAIDTIIEDSFKELKIKGFCSSSVAFCAQTSPGVRNIYICDIDGQNVRQLTRVKTLCVEPAWSPSGNTVLYSKYGKSGISVVEMEVRPPNRSRMISAFPGINAGAALSPDGRKMAVILSPDHQVNLYVMDMATRKKQRLTTGKAEEASPVWSPDGRQIAFVSDQSGSPRIHVINADGTGRQILKSIGRTTVTPDWSKDNKIVYAALVNGNYTLGVYDMTAGKTSRVTMEPGNWESPAWAADNRHVVAKRTTGRTSGIFVVDTWTGKVRPLLQTNHPLSMPAWSPCRPKKTI